MKPNPNNLIKTYRNKCRYRVASALAAVLLLPAASVMADSFWIGGTADFNNDALWNPVGVPLQANGNVNADNDNGSNNVVLIETGDSWNPWDLRAGNGAGASGAFLQTGGTLTVGGWWRMAVGVGSYGNYVISNGVVNCELEAHVGEQGSGYLEVDGGTFSTVNNNIFSIGDGDFGTGTPVPTGTMVLNNGTVVCTGEFWVAEGNGNGADTGEGHFIMNGGSLTLHNWFAPGRFGGYGDVTLNNGWITKDVLNGGNFTMASGTAVATFTQNGGFFTNTLSQSWIAEGGTATYNLNGGQAIWGVVHMGQNGGAQGTLNVNGGVLSVTELTSLNGNGTVNFNGGTLRAGATTTTLMHDVSGSVVLQAGGLTIDTDGNDATVAQPIGDGGGGGLTKLGAGDLTLSGANTYSGATAVNAGELDNYTGNSVSGNFTVADGATLGTVVQAAGGQFGIPAVTLGSTAGANLFFDLGTFGNATAAPLNISGNLTANGTTVINIADGLAQIGQFPLVKYGTKSGSGTFTIGTLPLGVQAVIVNNALNNSIDLNITSVTVDEWQGLAGGNWDINVTTNWINSGTGIPAFYQDGNNVVINDTVQGTSTINLVANVKPASITIMNNNSNYTLVGNGMIGGPIGLNYQGIAPFTVGNTNNYTGKTTISAGWLTVSNLANGGSPSGIGASSASPTNLVLSGGALSYAGPSVTLNRGYQLTVNYMTNGVYGNSSIDDANNITLTGQATAVGQSSFIKTGAGTLSYTGSVTNTLSAGGSAPGYNVGGGTVVFDGSAGGQSNWVSTELWVGGLTNAAGNLVVTNTSLGVNAWIAVGRGNGSSGFISTIGIYNSLVNCGYWSLGYFGGYANNLETQVATINNSTVHIANGNVNIAESTGSTSTMTVSNSVITDNGPLLFGLSSGASGTLTLLGNTILTNNLWMSCGANGSGILNMQDNTFFAEGSDFNFGDYGAAGSSGTFNMSGNAHVVLTGNGNGVYVGKSGGSIGMVTQTGGILDATRAGVFQLAQSAGTTGTWLQSGGITYAGGWLSIGRGYDSGDLSPTGLYYISGGVLDQTGIGNGCIVGEQGTGTLTITNTGTVISEAQNVGVGIGWNGGTGTLNLETGGTLVANFIQQGGALGSAGTFNWDGGTLRAGAFTRLNFFSGLNSAVLMHSSTLDTSNQVIAIGQSLTDGGFGGGLTVQGNGTVYMNGANTYPGTTTVTSGTLGGNGSLAGPLVVQSGATLSPGMQAPLAVNNTVNLAAGSTTVLTFNAASNTNDKVTSSSSITYGGTLVLKNTQGALVSGTTYTVFSAVTYPGSFSSIQSETPGQTVTWDTTQLSVNGTVKITSITSNPVSVTSSVSGGNLTLGWPAGQTGFTLQMQSNPLTVGLSTNWTTVSGSSLTNSVTMPVGSTSSATFFRLVF